MSLPELKSKYLCLLLLLLGRSVSAGPSNNFFVNFWSGPNFGSTLSSFPLDSTGLGVCHSLTGRFSGQASSIKWSRNIELEVFDDDDCGGNRIVIASSKLYKHVFDLNEISERGFKAGEVRNLAEVCKHGSSGYSSSSVNNGISVNIGPGGCSRAYEVSHARNWEQCEEDWDNTIVSFMAFERTVGQRREYSK